jgi:hypothetical protein
VLRPDDPIFLLSAGQPDTIHTGGIHMSDMKELMYKGKPLVRCGNIIYYGSMTDKFVVKMEIKSSKKVGELDVADKVLVQLLTTDPNVRPRRQIIKSGEREGLYKALDAADFWLTRALSDAAAPQPQA